MSSFSHLHFKYFYIPNYFFLFSFFSLFIYKYVIIILLLLLIIFYYIFCFFSIFKEKENFKKFKISTDYYFYFRRDILTFPFISLFFFFRIYSSFFFAHILFFLCSSVICSLLFLSQTDKRIHFLSLLFC